MEINIPIIGKIISKTAVSTMTVAKNYKFRTIIKGYAFGGFVSI
jgi:hypothetical protein